MPYISPKSVRGATEHHPAIDNEKKPHRSGCFAQILTPSEMKLQKNLSKCDKSFCIASDCFAITVYRLGSIQRSTDELLRRKYIYFKVTPKPPYVFSRESEKEFFNYELTENINKLSTSEYITCRRIVHDMEFHGKDIEHAMNNLQKHYPNAIRQLRHELLVNNIEWTGSAGNNLPSQ